MVQSLCVHLVFRITLTLQELRMCISTTYTVNPQEEVISCTVVKASDLYWVDCLSGVSLISVQVPVVSLSKKLYPYLNSAGWL